MVHRACTDNVLTVQGTRACFGKLHNNSYIVLGVLFRPVFEFLDVVKPFWVNAYFITI